MKLQTTLTALLLSLPFTAPVQAKPSVIDQVAAEVCTKSYSTLKAAGKEETKQLFRSASRTVMKRSDNPMSFIRAISVYDDAEALGKAVFKSMKRQCRWKTKALFGTLSLE